MYQAILFDLDGTLLGLNNTKFLKVYLQAMAPRIAPYFNGHDFSQPILAGTEAMMQSQGRHASLRDLFIETFDRHSPVPFAELETAFNEFYEHEFNQVRSIATRLPHSLPVLQAAARHTDKIALATIPLFPAIAIEQRCRWAGIESFPFALITSFENMRYSKPNPEYYREIAHHLAVPADECLMIGNDHIDDLSAAAVGMETFLVLDDELNAGKSRYAPTYSGYLADLTTFLENL
ncbi:MAG TPA: HAD family hydrolase [bacterium]|nr:HAD family hydrolase [bacterium]HPN33521.1 HAD family hydrolase [bacterium]